MSLIVIHHHIYAHMYMYLWDLACKSHGPLLPALMLVTRSGL